MYLVKDIPAWERPIDVVDHDQNGIYELMVKFDRQLVIDYLESTGQVEGEVSLVLTGAVDGKAFEGADTIVVTRSAGEPAQSGY